MNLTDPKAMRAASYALPVATIAVALAQLAHFGLEKRFVASWLFIVFISLYLGWFLGQRSRNQEAEFFSTRIRPTDSDGRKSSVDLIAMLGATFLVGLLVLLPWLRPH